MTDELQDLLTQYGILSVSLSQLKSERPGSEHESLEAYYRSLGGILPDEPCIVCRISKDGETHFLDENKHDVTFQDEEGKKVGQVTVWELPEDEFWFFRAFRPGLFDITKDLPGYLYEIGIVYAYSLFEGYLSEIMHFLLRRHPQLMGGKRQLTYQHVFDTNTKEELIEELIDRQLRDLMYLPIAGVLHEMREQFGFRSLTLEYDSSITRLSLLRNCLLHNRKRVDAKLAAIQPVLKQSDRLSVSISDVHDAVRVLRKFAYKIDCAYEGIVRSSPKEQ